MDCRIQTNVLCLLLNQALPPGWVCVWTEEEVGANLEVRWCCLGRQEAGEVGGAGRWWGCCRGEGPGPAWSWAGGGRATRRAASAGGRDGLAFLQIQTFCVFYFMPSRRNKKEVGGKGVEAARGQALFTPFLEAWPGEGAEKASRVVGGSCWEPLP